jgi:hypothetical protein
LEREPINAFVTEEGSTDMATWIAAPRPPLLRRGSHAAPRRAVSRRRWSLAATVEILLDPAHAPGPRLNYWPRIPAANRVALAEPMQEIVTVLRDPGCEIAEADLERILCLATHPASPAYGSYPTQARFAAYSLAEDIRAAVNAHAS